MKIRFHYDEEGFRIRHSSSVKKVIGKIISDSGLSGGVIDFVFTSDEKVYEINREFLGHDYYTDVITFDYNEGRSVNGEIYISIERVRENAEKYKLAMISEIRRVIFHGILHLCGYDDKNERLRREMTEREDIYLALSFTE